MRPTLAFVVAVVILGGLQLYMTYRPQPRRVTSEAEVMAAGRFAVEVTLVFDAGPDAFALDTSDAPSLLVTLRGRDILRRTDAIPSGAQIVVEPVEGIVVGANEFYVQATPQDTTAAISRAVRVRVLRNGNPLAEQTLWSEPGDVVQGIVVVDMPAWSGAPKDGPADHTPTTSAERAAGHSVDRIVEQRVDQEAERA